MYTHNNQLKTSISNNNVKKPMIFMFAGQGSQSYHMGRELYDNDQSFRRVMNELDCLVKKEAGVSIISELYNDAIKKTNAFNDIRLTHPAIFMVEYSLTQSLIEKGIKPELVLGASLGEITAAAVCNVFTVEDALKLVIRQADMFHQSHIKGGMLAILHDVKIYEQIAEFHRNSDIAAINFDSNFIVAGSESGLSAIEQYLSAENITFLRLPVLQPFHSSLLESLKHEFNDLSSQAHFHQSSIPFISCAAMSIIGQFDRDHIWQVYRKPICIKQTLQNLEASGCYRYLDVGPGGTMANLVKYNSHVSGDSEIYSIMSPFGRDMKGFDRVLSELCV